MKIITWNVNGIRAVERKGEIQLLVENEKPDLLLLQEIKGNRDQFKVWLRDNPEFTQYYSSAEKKGYAGTGLWVSSEFHDRIGNPTFHTGIADIPAADEGRISWLSFDLDDKPWDVLSIYFPNGGKSEEAWREKLVFYDRIHDHMNHLRTQDHAVVVGGDMNVAHTEIDIARPKENDGKIGFHPDERAWMDRMISDGWYDVWRHRNPDVVDVYSWWDMVTRARSRNVGWRIDYFLTGDDVMERIAEAEYMNHQMGSDHCPLKMVVNTK